MSSPALPRTDEGKRICQVIRVRPERLAEYKKARRIIFPGPWMVFMRQVHAEVWPDVIAALRRAHIVGESK